MLPPFFRQVRLFALLGFTAALSFAQASQTDQIQIAPPTRQIQAPSKDASAQELEKQADELRSKKEYLDALDYYRAAIVKSPQSAALFNKLGIAELMLERYKDAGKDFGQALKKDRKFAEPYNNLGVVDYKRRRYGAAVKQYKKAIELAPDNASFYSNLGAAYFARKEFEQASRAYAEAIRIDPEIFEHTSHTGIAAQLASSEDRAHYDYVLAKLYAKMGDRDRALSFLRKAMEDGYKAVNDAYTDPEFAELRKDTRFADLMKQKPPAIPE
jgi:tetratricopeptide (TPR) repeat protein